ncbi:MAG: cytochrome c3 family protein [Magnetococcales bacterium]|nr:cytochrome c3 family protein [Magnetococcales bacterium]
MKLFSKKTSKIALAIVCVAALMGTKSALAGVAGSKHDLGSGGAAQAQSTLTTEVCVFCHTPHGSEASAKAPLWNKTLTTTDFSSNRYDGAQSTTIDGANITVGSVSLACLTCHDGSQAMDVMINAPGTSDTLTAARFDATAFGTGIIDATSQRNLGTDLSNDHPVSIQYGGGGITTGNLVTADADFVDPQYASINGNDAWWVDVTGGKVNGVAVGGNAGTREKSDMILYTTGAQPYVECASCHDPHNSDTGLVTNQVSFLRIDNTGSAVCLACHTK